MSIAGRAGGPVVVGVEHGIGVLTLEQPPVNALSSALRAAIGQALQALTADATLRALVLSGAGRGFSAGADIRDLGGASREPTLPQLIEVLESFRVPVIAALHGPVLGGGLELALGAHYRIANATAMLGLPEITLGLIPGAGGTQRLPRLVGVEAALEMISTGAPINAARALQLGLIDELSSGELLPAALDFARALLKADRGPRPVRSQPAPTDAAGTLAAARIELMRRRSTLPAPLRVLDALQACTTLTFEEGLKVEREAFLSLRDSPESVALRYAFAAEREAARPPAALAGLTPRPMQQAIIVGAGTMGQGIAVALAEGGLDVQLLDADAAALQRALTAIAAIGTSRVARGKLSAEAAEAIRVRIRPIQDLSQCREADLLIEAVYEDLEVKRGVLARAESMLRPDTILATNTSYLDIESLAQATQRPQNVIGLHFFSPAHVMKLLEIVPIKRTDPVVQATALALGKRLGKQAVLVGNARGFVGNRMLARRTREAYFLLEEGATPWQVDQAFTGYGFPMGPFAVGDLAGLDIGWRNRRAVFEQLTPREQQCTILDELIEAGRLGQKAGRGFYRYDAQRRAELDPEVEALIERHAARIGRTRRAICEEEILQRCLFAMIDEGARILGEGGARAPSDIDVVWLHGYGFPRHRGGPMHYADRIGLSVVCEAIHRFRDEFGARYWEVAPLLARLAEAGGSFQDWAESRAEVT